MKLLLENWRKYLNEVNYSGPPLNYSSVVLDGNHALAVLKAAEQLRAEGKVPPEFVKSSEGKWPHHMTINMGPLLPGWENDVPMKLTIDGWGMVDDGKNRAMAFRVDPASLKGLPVKNAVPHITALVPPDGKPFHSNKIVDWQPFGPLDVAGVVVEQTKQQKKKKEKPQRQKPKGQDNPVEFAKNLAARGLPPEQIKNIIMKKFGKPEQAALGIMRGAGIQ